MINAPAVAVSYQNRTVEDIHTGGVSSLSIRGAPEGSSPVYNTELAPHAAGSISCIRSGCISVSGQSLTRFAHGQASDYYKVKSI